MNDRHLATYVNDHLAGSVVALQLLEHPKTLGRARILGHFLAELRADILADRKELEALMGRLRIGKSITRRGMAWLAEKMTELKLRLDDPAEGSLWLLEVLEAVSVGIEAKRLLWRSLAAAAAHEPRLAGFDYERLERRAEEQRRRLEGVRLEAANAALATATA